MKQLMSTHRLVISVLGLITLSGCVSVSLDDTINRVQSLTEGYTEGTISVSLRQEDRAQRQKRTEELLAQTLGQKEAVHLYLTNSPALQALLANGSAEAMTAAQSGRIANPLFSVERMVQGNELEWGRAFSFGLLDLITLPLRANRAERRMEQAQMRLSAEVIDRVTEVRMAWVRAVGAQQTLLYTQQVADSAKAGAELARRMQAVGNFNRLSRAKEQLYYADAVAQLAHAHHQALVYKEALMRLLGLDAEEAESLKLPERLPDLPDRPIEPQAVSAISVESRLDIRLAQNALAESGKAQGLNLVSSFTDIELIARRKKTIDRAESTQTVARGYELDIRLPIFDWGGMTRDSWNARTYASAQHLEATVRSVGSHLRELYSAYRTAYDMAKHYRDDIVPLRRLISDENLLRYNGMLIGVFDLLLDAREQSNSVLLAISAQQQFWLAHSSLQAGLIGRPNTTSLSFNSSAPMDGGADH